MLELRLFLRIMLLVLMIINVKMLLAKIILKHRMKRDYHYGYESSTEEMDQLPYLWLYKGHPKSMVPIRNTFITYQPKYNYNREKQKSLNSLQLKKNNKITTNYIESPFSVQRHKIHSVSPALTDNGNSKRISHKIETSTENINKDTFHLNFPLIDRKQEGAKRIFNLNDTKNLEKIVMARFNELFISRKRYETDLIKLRKYYELKCVQKLHHHQHQIKNNTITKKFDNVMKRPIIVRYEKMKPSEISIQTEIMVKDPEVVTALPYIPSSLSTLLSTITPLNAATLKIDNKLDFGESHRKRRSIQLNQEQYFYNNTNNSKHFQGSNLYNNKGDHIYENNSNYLKNKKKSKEKFWSARSKIGKKIIDKNSILYYDNDDDDDDDDDYNEQYDNYFDEEDHVEDVMKSIKLENAVNVKPISVNYSTKPKVKNATLTSASSEHKNLNGEITTAIRKRIRRRPPSQHYNNIDNDDDDDDNDDDDDDDGSYNDVTRHLSSIFRIIVSPVKMIMSTFIDHMSHKYKYDNENHVEPTSDHYPQYNVYSSPEQQQNDVDYYDEYDYKSEENHNYEDNEDGHEAATSNWFSSWFNFNRRNKKISSTSAAPSKSKPLSSTYSWLPSWLYFGMDTKTKDDYDKWFSSWFGEIKNRTHRRKTTIAISTTTQMPHVPILTIVDPQRNPHNWIGILTNQMINNDTITLPFTQNPIVEVATPSTTTTSVTMKLKPLTYDRYQIWRLKPLNEGQVSTLEGYKLTNNGMKLRWLRGPSLRGLTDVLVSPKMFSKFHATLSFDSIDHEVLVYNVGKAISYEKFKENYNFHKNHNNEYQLQKQQEQNANITTVSMTWHKYYTYDEIIRYLEEIQYNYPKLIELIHIGRSYEGRPLIIVKIERREAQIANTSNEMPAQKLKLSMKRISFTNTVFIEAGVHGMEWIAPATATWIINKLLNIMNMNNTSHSEWPKHNLIRNTTWYIMPILNVDGYVYSHDYDRFWKKTRSQHVSEPINFFSTAMEWLKPRNTKRNVKCYGVDLDRNWHYQWNRYGASKLLCNENYVGPAPFSEPETKALAEFLLGNHAQIKLFISLQAYGQVLSYPIKGHTGYNTAQLDDMLDVAMFGIERLRKKFTKSRYKVDSSNDLIEHRSGTSDAFAAYELGIRFAYTLHLSDNGVHGYLLPSTAIEPTAIDAFEIITNMLDYV